MKAIDASTKPIVAALACAVAFTITTQAQIPIARDSRVSLSLPLQGSEDLSYGAVTESSTGGEESASELNRKLTNPVSSIWSIQFQFNNFELNNGQWNNNCNFQPVMPVSLTKDWNLITRPVMPIYSIVPHETHPDEFARDAGLGDLTLVEILSPANSGNWVLGAGPTAIFPTATSMFTGQGKWQLGPTFVAGYLTKQSLHRRVSPAMVVHRRAARQARHEPDELATHRVDLLRRGLEPRVSGNILADWNAPPHDVWTVPVGLGLGKVVKFGRLPVKINLAVQYMPVHPGSPDRSGTCRSRSLLSFQSSSRASCSSDAKSSRTTEDVHEWLEPIS